MISAYIIFTTLATTALAQGSIDCNFSETSGMQQCFGAVGQQLIFHMSYASNPDITLKKDNKYLILKMKKNNVTVHKEYVNCTESLIRGVFKLGKAMKKHSGDYLLEEFGSDGRLQKRVNVHLEINAPVSKPVVSQTCLSPEQMKVSCSSEGDGVQFNLTLNSLLPMLTRGHSQSPSTWTANNQSPTGNTTENSASVSENTISLDGQSTGDLMCLVWNNVSRDETIVPLISCKDFPVVPVAVTASVLTLLLLVALCICMIHLHNKSMPTTIDEGNSDDEIVYTEVRVIQRPRD